MVKRFVRHLLLAFAALVVVAGSAQAVKNIDVSAGVHNLSTSAPIFSPYADSNVTEVCIFCHTPHSAAPDAPLWNRVNPSISFTMYKSNNPNAQADGTQTINSESLICLSCHDGSIATNAILNESFIEGTPDQQYLVAFPTNPLALIGAARDASGNLYTGGTDHPAGWETGHLEDDHPVSIDMKLAYGDGTGYGAGFNDPAALPASSQGVTVDLQFYGNAGEYFVECSTCHDPHVDYTSAAAYEDHTPFLRMPNTGSAMCFACHNK